MEDKFGYLMKQEFEEDFLEQVRDLMRKEKSYKDPSPLQLHTQVVMTWGGNHERDTEIKKIR